MRENRPLFFGLPLAIQGPQSGGQELVFLVEYRSVLVEKAPLKFVRYVRNPDHPEAITPGFVRQAILYGLANGWHPTERKPMMIIEWQPDLFLIQAQLELMLTTKR